MSEMMRVVERGYIRRYIRNDTERLEKLIIIYAQIIVEQKAYVSGHKVITADLRRYWKEFAESGGLA